MGCATGLVKYFVFIANLVFALAGLGLIIVGILYKFNYSEATNALPSDFGLAPVLSIIIGAIVFITAFLGCCGAVKESPCMLTTYAVILLTLFIVQVAIGVYAFIKIKDEHEFKRTVHNGLQKTFDEYGRNEEARDTVNVLQRFLECCGLDNYNEMQLPNGSLPISCCKSDVSSCRSTNYNSLHNTPCAAALDAFLQTSAHVVEGVAIGIAIIEIIGAVFGLCLASSIRNHYRRNIYT